MCVINSTRNYIGIYIMKTKEWKELEKKIVDTIDETLKTLQGDIFNQEKRIKVMLTRMEELIRSLKE